MLRGGWGWYQEGSLLKNLGAVVWTLLGTAHLEIQATHAPGGWQRGGWAAAGSAPTSPADGEEWGGYAEIRLLTQRSCGLEGTVNLKMKAGSAHSVVLLILTAPQMSSGRNRVGQISGTIHEQNVQLFPS